MKHALILLSLVASGCGAPQPLDAATDRHGPETVVAECDRGARRADCDDARRSLSEARRDDRMAAYRDAF